MEKIIFIVFLFSASFVFSQTDEEESELDNILDELFGLDSFER